MMINRWTEVNPGYGLHTRDDGEYVLYTDHANRIGDATIRILQLEAALKLIHRRVVSTRGWLTGEGLDMANCILDDISRENLT